MSWYKNHKDDWRGLIATIQEQYQIPAKQTEKDTVQSMLLARLNTCPTPFVFKGGTSLSKGYNIIKRFSEDVDMTISEPLSLQSANCTSSACFIFRMASMMENRSYQENGYMKAPESRLK